MCNSNFALVPIILNNFKTPTIYSLSIVTANTACVLFLTLTLEIYFIVYISVVTLGQFSYVHISEPWKLPLFLCHLTLLSLNSSNGTIYPSVVSLTRLFSEHFILYITFPLISQGVSCTCFGVISRNRPRVSFFFAYFGGLLRGMGRGGNLLPGSL